MGFFRSINATDNGCVKMFTMRALNAQTRQKTSFTQVFKAHG